MPSLHDPALEERFDELAAQIRGARPRASEALRQRVTETAARDVPVPEPKRRPRLVPILAFAAVLLIGAVVAFAAGGLRDGSGARSAAVESTPTELRQATEGAGPAADSDAPQTTQAPAGFPPSPTRLQLYRAQMTIRVDSTADSTPRPAARSGSRAAWAASSSRPTSARRSRAGNQVGSSSACRRRRRRPRSSASPGSGRSSRSVCGSTTSRRA